MHIPNPLEHSKEIYQHTKNDCRGIAIGRGGSWGAWVPVRNPAPSPWALSEMTLCTGVYGETPFWVPFSPPCHPVILKRLAMLQNDSKIALTSLPTRNHVHPSSMITFKINLPIAQEYPIPSRWFPIKDKKEKKTNDMVSQIHNESCALIKWGRRILYIGPIKNFPHPRVSGSCWGNHTEGECHNQSTNRIVSVTILEEVIWLLWFTSSKLQYLRKCSWIMTLCKTQLLSSLSIHYVYNGIKCTLKQQAFSY